MHSKPTSPAWKTPAAAARAAVCGLLLFAWALLAQAAPPVIEYFTPTGGPTGTQVTIVGENFDDNGKLDLTVTFNGQPATILHYDTDSVTVAIPGGTQDAPLLLSHADGSTSTSQPFISSPMSLRLDPYTVTIFEGQTRAINAIPLGTTQGVTWEVDAIPGGNASVGTITGSGTALYTAPAQVPNPNRVLVSATLVANPAIKAVLPVSINDPGGGIPDMKLIPSTVDDVSNHPEIGLNVSRTRVLVLLEEGASMAGLLPIMQQHQAVVIGGAPEFNLMELAVPDGGDFAAPAALISALSGAPGVSAVEHDVAISPMVVNGRSTDTEVLVIRDENANKNAVYSTQLTRNVWQWEINPAGANWGLEYSNFPQAWNLFHYVENLDVAAQAAGTDRRIVNVGVSDSSVKVEHYDMSAVSERVPGGNTLSEGPGGAGHGTHVAGIIGADFRNKRGVSGASPFVSIKSMGYTSEVATIALPANMTYTYSGLLGDEVLGQLRTLVNNTGNLRVINISQGYNWFSNQFYDFAPPFKYRTAPGSNVITGLIDLVGPPEMHPTLRQVVEHHGKMVVEVAKWIEKSASGHNAIIVCAAGNDATDISAVISQWGWADLTATSGTAGAVQRLQAWKTPQAQYGSPFTWAAYNGAPNILVVEALEVVSDRDRVVRTDFSNYALPPAGNPNWKQGFSAPGSTILSPSVIDHTTTTLPTGPNPWTRIFEYMSGTSQASPQVAGLLAYLLAVDPTLTRAELFKILDETSRPQVNGSGQTVGAPAVDAYKAVMQIDKINEAKGTRQKWIKKALLNIDDGTLDGNDRQNPDDVHGSGLLPPDMRINMADFRRLRDAFLIVTNKAQNLNGPTDSPKLDLNEDGRIESGARENIYPRMDFDGDGELKDEDFVFFCDADLWNDEDYTQDSLNDQRLRALLRPLLESGDFKLDVNAIFEGSDINLIKVTAKVEREGGGYDTFKMNLDREDIISAAGGDKRKILTLPADRKIRLYATAYHDTEYRHHLLTPQDPSGETKLKVGQDKTITFLKTKVKITPSKFTVAYNSTATIAVDLELSDGSTVAYDPELYNTSFTVPPLLGTIQPSAAAFTVTSSHNPGVYPFQARLTTVEGDPVNDHEEPEAEAEATVRTAVVKNPAGLALDGADNMYVTDSERNRIIMIPPSSAGFTLLDNLDTPGPLEVDARGRSVIYGEANGKVTRTFFGISGTVKDTTGSLVVGARVYLETPAGTLPGPGSAENRYLTNGDGKFSVMGLLAPEMGNDPVKIAVTIEYRGKPQVFPITLNPIGQTIIEFRLREEED